MEAANVLAFKSPESPLEAFGASLATRGASEGTIRVYGAALRAAEVICGPLEAVKLADVQRWNGVMRLAGLSPSTRSVRMAAIREFCAWMVASDMVQADPLARAGKSLRVSRKDTERSAYLWRGLRKQSREALDLWLDAEIRPGGGAENRAGALRDRALVRVLMSTGMRAAEVASLELGDLVDEGEVMTVRVLGKGGKIRPAVFGRKATESVRRYLEARGNPSEGPVFLSDAGTSLRYSKAVWRIVARAKKQAGVRDRLTPHSMRHARADDLLERTNGDLAAVADALGHASVETTRGYLSRNPKLMKARLERAGALD